jgi:hypothetical protein
MRRVTRVETVSLDQMSGPRWFCARVIKTELFDMFILSIVLLNILQMIQDADLSSEEKTSDFVIVTGYLCMTVYATELAIRIYVDRWLYFSPPANKFDFAIVVIDIASEILGKVTPLPSVALLRIFRVMRIMQVIRRMESFRELWLMLHGLASATKAMLWACVLVSFVLTFFSLISVTVIKPVHKDLEEDGAFAHCDACSGAFDTVAASFQTWFYIVFIGDLWSDLVVPLGKERGFIIVIFFAGFIGINLGIMNLILTVIVDRAAEARADDEAFLLDEKKEGYMNSQKRLLTEFKILDADDSGVVSLREMQQGYDEGGTFASALKAMDVDKSDLETVFSIIDQDRSGSVTYTEFASELHKMKTQDSHILLVFIKHYVLELRREFVAFKEGLIGNEVVDPKSQLSVGGAKSSDVAIKATISSSVSVADRNMSSPSDMGTFHDDIFVGEAEAAIESETMGASLPIDINGQLGRWRIHGTTSKLDTSPKNVNFVELANPNEVSMHTEHAVAVCTELRRLSEKIEDTLSGVFTGSAVI